MPDDVEDSLLKLLLHAYPDRVTVRRAGDASRGVMVGGRGVVLESSCVVREAPLFLSIAVRDTPGGGEARVSMASAIREEWLGEVHPHLLERRTVHRFDEERAKVVTIRETVFAGLVLREDITGQRADAEGIARALADHLGRNAPAFFAGDEGAAKWLGRLRFVARHMPDLELPPADDAFLRAALEDACRGCASIDQIRGRGLRGALENQLSWKQRGALDEHAPEALAVPSGNKIKLDYGDGTGAPVLAVRVQELFGLAETPRLAAGRAPVQLHLLGPNYRPVQVTMDLRNFWNTTYAEVRRELRARYPKHPWPDDPWNAPPVSVGRRRPG